VWHQPVGRAFPFDLLGGLAERQRLALRENVGEQYVVVWAERIERPCERDEVARDQPRPLMDQLIERVLAVGAGLTPVDGTRIGAHRLPVESHLLAVTLHRELLEVGGEALEVLLVGQHRDRLRAEEVVVPDR